MLNAVQTPHIVLCLDFLYVLTTLYNCLPCMCIHLEILSLFFGILFSSLNLFEKYSKERLT